MECIYRANTTVITGVGLNMTVAIRNEFNNEALLYYYAIPLYSSFSMGNSTLLAHVQVDAMKDNRTKLMEDHLNITSYCYYDASDPINTLLLDSVVCISLLYS